jgi:hypothetical protein
MARQTALEKARAELLEAQTELTATRAETERVREALIEAQTDRDRWRTERLTDREAECLSMCVRAIEEFRHGPVTRAPDGAAMTPTNANPGRYYPPEVQYGTISSPMAQAHETPIGRVLLNLAQRFDVPLAPFERPPRVEEGQELVSVPAAVASQLQRLYDVGQFR